MHGMPRTTLPHPALAPAFMHSNGILFHLPFLTQSPLSVTIRVTPITCDFPGNPLGPLNPLRSVQITVRTSRTSVARVARSLANRTTNICWSSSSSSSSSSSPPCPPPPPCWAPLRGGRGKPVAQVAQRGTMPMLWISVSLGTESMRLLWRSNRGGGKHEGVHQTLAPSADRDQPKTIRVHFGVDLLPLSIRPFVTLFPSSAYYFVGKQGKVFF